MDRPSARTVLVVDDSAAYADNLRQILDSAGYRVLLAATREAATALAAADTFDVAIIDSRLPDSDGASLSLALKAQRPRAELILFASTPLVGAAVSTVKTDLWACLTKPYPTADLLLLVREAVHQVLMHEEQQQLSERVLVAEKLAAAGTLSAGLSHEIRNPLNSMGLQFSVLERRVKRRVPADVQPDLLEPLAAIRHELDRLNRLVGDFLDFARPREFAPSPVDLVALAESVRTLLAPQASDAGLQLECHCGPARTIVGEADRMRQALINLVLNAIQATPAGGLVRMEVGESNGEVFLAVEDTGPGIPATVRPRLFEPFYTTKPTGTGLGLPIVYSIVRRHGGNLSLDEARPRGARFVMKFTPAAAS